MRLRPMPVVMVSSYTEAGSEETLRALELGAVDFIGKPRVDDERRWSGSPKILPKRFAPRRTPTCVRPVQPSRCRSRTYPRPDRSSHGEKEEYFVLEPDGGTQALKVFLQGMPADCPPVLVVQHMPETFWFFRTSTRLDLPSTGRQKPRESDLHRERSMSHRAIHT